MSDKECWCPCRCGCKDEALTPCGRLLENGLCYSCNEGKHEVPPESVIKLDDLIKAHESILEQLWDLKKSP